jgi:hypothetical protein
MIAMKELKEPFCKTRSNEKVTSSFHGSGGKCKIEIHH